MKNESKKGLPPQTVGRMSQKEKHGGKSLAERIGYTDFSKRMASIQLAGENLREFRANAQLFDAVGETDIDKIDWQQVKVRSLGFNLADYSEYSKAVAQRKAELYERIGQQKKAKAIKDAIAAKEKTLAAEAAKSSPPVVGGGLGAADAPD